MKLVKGDDNKIYCLGAKESLLCMGFTENDYDLIKNQIRPQLCWYSIYHPIQLKLEL